MGIFSPQIATSAMVPLCRQLATSHGAGIPILRALQLVSQSTRDKKLRDIIMAMHDDIRIGGTTLAQAARKQERFLPRIFIELLASGELGGRLDHMLRDLADYYEDRLTMRRNIIRMSIYPGIQLTMAWFLGTFALMLIRRLSFTSNGFNLSNYFSFYLKFQTGAMLLFGTAIVICIILARMGIFKWISGWVGTFIWPLAPITQRFGRARFFRSLSLLIGSGMPIAKAIESAAAVTVNPYMERDFLKVVPGVEAGMSLVDSFSVCKFMTPETREMLLVGEESGELEGALRKTADYQMEEATHAVQVAARVMGVAVSLAIALVVGYIVISFYSRYFGMLDEITKTK